MPAEIIRAWKHCPYCGRFVRARNTFCNREHYHLSRRGSGPGHIRIRVNGERVYLHRLVMEQMLGRPLTPDEIVHHKDDDKKNNKPRNLHLCEDRAAHLAEHDWWRDRRGLAAKTRKCGAEIQIPAERDFDDEMPF